MRRDRKPTEPAAAEAALSYYLQLTVPGEEHLGQTRASLERPALNDLHCAGNRHVLEHLPCKAVRGDHLEPFWKHDGLDPAKRLHVKV